MAKNRQHIVPRVHLKRFTTTDRPGHEQRAEVVPFVWLVPKDLVGPPVARSPQKAFVKTRAYNVAGDDPEAPWLEEGLGRLEGEYGTLVPRLILGEEPSTHDYGVLILFVGALYSRTLHNLDNVQGTMEHVEHLHRQAERAHTGSERLSDRYFRDGEDMSRRALPGQVESYAKVVAQTGWLLHSQCPMEFISSDNPVAHHFCTRDELVRAGFPSSWINSAVGPATEAFLSVCPLSPNLVFLSSPLMVPPSDSMFRATADFGVVFAINELVRRAARAVLISRTPRPYGPIQEQVAAHDRERAEWFAATPYKLSVRTRRSRVLLSATALEHVRGDTPLQSAIRFRTPDIALLRDLAEDMWVEEVQLSGNDGSGGGMRNAVFTSVATHPEGDTVILQDLARWPDSDSLGGN